MWCASLDEPPLPPERLLNVLSIEERSTARHYVFQRDRWRSAASRGLLRWLLGGYLRIPPEQASFRLGPHGKPALTGQAASNALSFNVAHSDGIALYAVTRGREIGVDIERVRPMPDAAEIATRFFARSEVSTLLGLPAEQVDESFFVGWTRKEAYVKARGTGLALPLDEFEVRLDRGEGTDRLRVPADPDQGAPWSLLGISPLPGFIGAVAIPDRNLQIACRHWT